MLVLDEKTQTAELEKAGMGIDLGSAAKGFGIDEVRRILAANGIENGLINMGASSISAIGQNEGKPWRIGVIDPRGEDNELLGVLELTDMTLSTSGDYQRYFEANGERYHHILDPRTGSPAKGGLMSVTVTAKNNIENAGLMTDMLTTAIFVLGADKGKEFLDNLPEGYAGLLVFTDGSYYMTADFAKNFTLKSDKYHER